MDTPRTSIDFISEIAPSPPAEHEYDLISVPVPEPEQLDPVHIEQLDPDFDVPPPIDLLVSVMDPTTQQSERVVQLMKTQTTKELITGAVLDTLEQLKQHSAPPAPEPAQSVDDFTKLYLIVKKKTTKPLTPAKIITLISTAVKAAEEFYHLTDEDKKALVIQAVKQAITEIDALHIDNEGNQELLDMVDIVLNPVADSLMYFTQNTVLFMKAKASKLASLPIFKCCQAPEPEKLMDLPVDQLEQFVNLNIQRPFTTDRLVQLVTACIKFMQRKEFNNYYGAAKKNAILGLIKHELQESVKVEDSDRAALIKILDTVCSDLIDAAVVHGRY